MATLYGPINSGAGAGGAGVATNNATTAHPLHGLVIWAYIKYNDSPPAGTTDVTVATLGTSPSAPAQTILSISNAATDGYFYPRVNACNTSGTSQSAQWEMIAIHDYVKVTIAQANNDDSVDVWLLLADV